VPLLTGYSQRECIKIGAFNIGTTTTKMQAGSQLKISINTI
jgi:hypothetical protein